MQDLLPDVLPALRPEALDVQEHLRLCPECAEAAEALAHTLVALRSGAEPGPVLDAAFADRVLAALPDAPPGSLGEELAPALAGRGAGWLLPFALRVAAAALLFAAGALAGPALRRAEPDAAPSVAERPAPQPAPRALPVPPAPREQDDVPPARVAAALPPSAAFAGASPAFAREDPLQAYVSEASLVLEAVRDLDGSDPRALTLLARHVRRAALVETGDRLLVSLGAPRLEPLQPLIRGTQLILRKVRHAETEGGAHGLWALREEVERTGILDAYRELLSAQPAVDVPPEPTGLDPL